MAKQLSREKKPSQRSIDSSLKRLRKLESVTREELAKVVTDILLGANVNVEKRGGSARFKKADLSASRIDLGLERRFAIEIVLAITAEKIREGYADFRNYVQQSKQPFSEFDEYWLVGFAYEGEPLRKRPENDRHFRVVDVDELRALFAPPPRSTSQGKAKTNIGKAIEARKDELALTIAGLMLQLDAKIETLRESRPNSPEAIAEQDSHISEYAKMRAQLEALQAAVDAFTRGNGKEGVAVNSVKTFAEGVRSWWNKEHRYILSKSFDLGLFATAVGICALTGAGGIMSVTIAGAFVGGKPVTAALRALPKRFLNES